VVFLPPGNLRVGDFLPGAAHEAGPSPLVFAFAENRHLPWAGAQSPGTLGGGPHRSRQRLTPTGVFPLSARRRIGARTYRAERFPA